MAAPGCWWMLLITLLCYSLRATAIGEPFESASQWGLAMTVPTCDPPTPVCGEGGINYESSCHAIAAGVRIISNGACSNEVKKPASCAIRCFRADPVCGEDGVTYWCGAAEAKCAGVEVAHLGYCDLKSGGPGEKGLKAAQSLFLVHLIWLVLAGFLVVAGFP